MQRIFDSSLLSYRIGPRVDTQVKRAIVCVCGQEEKMNDVVDAFLMHHRKIFFFFVRKNKRWGVDDPVVARGLHEMFEVLALRYTCNVRKP